MNHLTPQITLALIDMAKVLALALLLVWYVQNRRYPKERMTASWAGVVGYHIVEIGLIAAMVPTLAMLAKLLPGN